MAHLSETDCCALTQLRVGANESEDQLKRAIKEAYFGFAGIDPYDFNWDVGLDGESEASNLFCIVKTSERKLKKMLEKFEFKEMFRFSRRRLLQKGRSELIFMLKRFSLPPSLKKKKGKK